MDSGGSIQWQKCLGGTNSDGASSIIQTNDGGFIVAGITNSNDIDVNGNHGVWDCWIVKLNSAGGIQWQKCYGGTQSDDSFSIIQTPDGGYIFAGQTDSNDGDVSGNHGGVEDCWIVKIDSAGGIQWQKCLGGTQEDRASSIIQTLDGGYIVAGSSTSNDGDVSGNHNEFFFDYWIVKLSSSGAIQWQKCFGGEVDDFARSIIQNADGSYIVAGATYSFGGDITGPHGLIDAWVIKISNSGALQWQKCLGSSGDDAASSLIQSSDGGYIIAGSSGYNDGDISGNHGSADYWVVKLTSAGAIQWQKCLGGTIADNAASIIQTSDGGYAVAGETFSNDGDVTGYHLNGDIWVVKLSPIVGIEEENNFSFFDVYPNPVSSQFKVESSKLKVQSVELYDLLGQKVISLKNINAYETMVNVSNLKAGIYFVEVTDEKGNRVVRKVVKM